MAVPGTPVGILDGPARAEVDPRGAVTGLAGGWSLDWWIGAEDRWHEPADSPTVRQALLGACPVVETRLRVPSGDAVQRVFAARDRAGTDVVVVEVHNETKVPFAAALVLRAPDGRPVALELASRTVTADGVPAAHLAGWPGRVAAGPDEATVRAVVTGGGAVDPRGALPEPAGVLALVLPVAHTATVRVALPLAVLGPAVELGALPDARQVVAGWQAQARRGTRLTLPERRLQEGVDARVRRALLLGGDDPWAAPALALAGFATEADRALARSLDEAALAAAPGRALLALARHAVLVDDAGAVPLVAELVARLAAAPAGDDLARGALGARWAVRLLDRHAGRRAARDARRAADALTGRAGPRPAADELVRAALGEATGTWHWSDAAAGDGARALDLLEGTRGLLVDDDADDVLRLAPAVPTPWRGQGWEVHDLPTAHGLLSYAVRWHGARPALLWDLRPARGPVELRFGLDPSWSSTAPRGDALLEPVELPPPPERKGLSIPVTIEPLRRR